MEHRSCTVPFLFVVYVFFLWRHEHSHTTETAKTRQSVTLETLSTEVTQFLFTAFETNTELRSMSVCCFKRDVNNNYAISVITFNAERGAPHLGSLAKQPGSLLEEPVCFEDP